MIHRSYKRLQLALRRGTISIGKRLKKRDRRAIAPTGSEIDFNGARVLLLRQNQIGDALISIPVIHALKAHYPGITIDVLLNRRNRQVFDTDHNINRILTIKLKKFDVISVLRDIRRTRYDFIVDLVHSPSTTSSLFCLLGNAQTTVGPTRENDYCYDVKVDLVHPNRAGTQRDTMMRRFMQTLQAFNIDPEAVEAQSYFNLDDDAVSFATSLMQRIRGDDHQSQIFAINISGSKPEKYWGTERYITLVRRLHRDNPDARFLMLYSGEYEEQANAIADATGASLSGGTSTLPRFAAAICAADLLISPDSAAVHLADIYQVPTVSLYVDPAGETLWLPSFCPFEGVHGDGNNSGLNTITPDAVADAAARVLKRSPISEGVAQSHADRVVRNSLAQKRAEETTRLAG